jgi:aminoglycoside 3-N-acetyltransferase
MLTYHDFSSTIQNLNIPSGVPLIVHASMSAFGPIKGGAETILGSIFTVSDQILFPAFTYKTMITPEVGPDMNGIKYGSGKSSNAMAEFFHQNMPVDPLIGEVAEKFRWMPEVKRSAHPILSFCGRNLDAAIELQSMEDPLHPIQMISEMDGWVLLLGVDHTCNTSLHLAEKMASRRQFIRWALTETGVVECPSFPGCSDGFNQIKPVIQDISRQVALGNGWVEAVPIRFMVEIARSMMVSNPQALLCSRKDCPRCNTIRNDWGNG